MHSDALDASLHAHIEHSPSALLRARMSPTAPASNHVSAKTDRTRAARACTCLQRRLAGQRRHCGGLDPRFGPGRSRHPRVVKHPRPGNPYLQEWWPGQERCKLLARRAGPEQRPAAGPPAGVPHLCSTIGGLGSRVWGTVWFGEDVRSRSGPGAGVVCDRSSTETSQVLDSR